MGAGQTVNLLSYDSGGSTPSAGTNADVAQRSEQDAYIVKVMGSNPVISTRGFEA